MSVHSESGNMISRSDIQPNYGFVELAGFHATAHIEGAIIRVKVTKSDSQGQRVLTAMAAEPKYRDTIQAALDILETTLLAWSHHELDPNKSYYLGEVTGDYRAIHEVGSEEDVFYVEGRYGSSMPVVRANDTFQQCLLQLAKII